MKPLTGAEFRALRKRLGFTQEELAQVMGASRGAISAYERPGSSRKPTIQQSAFMLYIAAHQTPADPLAMPLTQLAAQFTAGQAGKLELAIYRDSQMVQTVNICASSVVPYGETLMCFVGLQHMPDGREYLYEGRFKGDDGQGYTIIF